MIPFSMTDTAGTHATGTVITLGQAVPEENWAFDDVFSVFTSAAVDGLEPIPIVSTAQEEPLPPNDASRNATADLSPTQSSDELTVSTAEFTDTQVEPAIAAPDPTLGERKSMADVVEIADGHKSFAFHEAPNTTTNKPIERKELSAEGNPKRSQSTSQSILEGRLTHVPTSNLGGTSETNRGHLSAAVSVPLVENTAVPPQPLLAKAQLIRPPLANLSNTDQPTVSDLRPDRYVRDYGLPPPDTYRGMTHGPIRGMEVSLMMQPTATNSPPVLDPKGRVRTELPVDVELLFSVSSRVSSSLQATVVIPVMASSETARHAANQIAVAISTQPGRVTEIALNPDELGRLRLSMTTTDTSITLTVLAERPETNDLLRRHIDVLAEEFKSLGYDNISFSFSDGEQAHADSASDETVDQIPPADIDEIENQNPNQQHMAQSGLDLRM